MNQRTNKKNRSTSARGGRGKGVERQLSIEGVYSNHRFMQSVGSIFGLAMQVQTHTKETYEGIFSSFSPDLSLVLDWPHPMRPESNIIQNPESIKRKMIFAANDFVVAKVSGVDFDYATKDSFAVDSEISRYNGQIKERALEPWNDSDSTGTTFASLDDGNANGWNADDMFKENEMKYGVKSTYSSDMEEYTTPLPKKNTKEWKEQEAKAEKVVKDIQSSSLTQARTDVENGEDEEAKFSAVIRGEQPHLSNNTITSGKYMPPQRRGIKQNTNKTLPRGSPSPQGFTPTSSGMGITHSNRHSSSPPYCNQPSIVSASSTTPSGSSYNKTNLPPHSMPSVMDSNINGDAKDSRRMESGQGNLNRDNAHPKQDTYSGDYGHPPHHSHSHHHHHHHSQQSFHNNSQYRKDSRNYRKEEHQVAELKKFGKEFVLVDNLDKKGSPVHSQSQGPLPHHQQGQNMQHQLSQSSQSHNHQIQGGSHSHPNSQISASSQGPSSTHLSTSQHMRSSQSPTAGHQHVTSTSVSQSSAPSHSPNIPPKHPQQIQSTTSQQPLPQLPQQQQPQPQQQTMASPSQQSSSQIASTPPLSSTTPSQSTRGSQHSMAQMQATVPSSPQPSSQQAPPNNSSQTVKQTPPSSNNQVPHDNPVNSGGITSCSTVAVTTTTATPTTATIQTPAATQPTVTAVIDKATAEKAVNSTLNPKAKEFCLNPDAEPFTPRLTPPRPQTPQVTPVPPHPVAAGGPHPPVNFSSAMVPSYVLPQPYPVPSQPRFAKRMPVTQRPELSQVAAAATGFPIFSPGPMTNPTLPTMQLQPQNIAPPTTQQCQYQTMMFRFPFVVPTSIGLYHPPSAESQQNSQSHNSQAIYMTPHQPHHAAAAQGPHHAPTPGPHPPQTPTPQGPNNAGPPPHNLPSQAPTPGHTPQPIMYGGAQLSGQPTIPSHFAQSSHTAHSPHNPYPGHSAPPVAAASHPIMVYPPMPLMPATAGPPPHSGATAVAHGSSSVSGYTPTSSAVVQHISQSPHLTYIPGNPNIQGHHHLPLVHHNQ